MNRLLQQGKISGLNECLIQSRHATRRWRTLSTTDSGGVTAEFALILPAVVLVIALLLGLTQTVSVSLKCQDAARSAARESVVHQGKGDPVGVARKVAGASAQVDIDRSDQQINISVSCPVLSSSFGVLPARVSGYAVGILDE